MHDARTYDPSTRPQWRILQSSDVLLCPLPHCSPLASVPDNLGRLGGAHSDLTKANRPNGIQSSCTRAGYFWLLTYHSPSRCPVARTSLLTPSCFSISVLVSEGHPLDLTSSSCLAAAILQSTCVAHTSIELTPRPAAGATAETRFDQRAAAPGTMPTFKTPGGKNVRVRLPQASASQHARRGSSSSHSGSAPTLGRVVQSGPMIVNSSSKALPKEVQSSTKPSWPEVPDTQPHPQVRTPEARLGRDSARVDPTVFSAGIILPLTHGSLCITDQKLIGWVGGKLDDSRWFSMHADDPRLTAPNGLVSVLEDAKQRLLVKRRAHARIFAALGLSLRVAALQPRFGENRGPGSLVLEVDPRRNPVPNVDLVMAQIVQKAGRPQAKLVTFDELRTGYATRLSQREVYLPVTQVKSSRWHSSQPPIVITNKERMTFAASIGDGQWDPYVLPGERSAYAAGHSRIFRPLPTFEEARRQVLEEAKISKRGVLNREALLEAIAPMIEICLWRLWLPHGGSKDMISLVLKHRSLPARCDCSSIP